MTVVSCGLLMERLYVALVIDIKTFISLIVLGLPLQRFLSGVQNKAVLVMLPWSWRRTCSIYLHLLLYIIVGIFSIQHSDRSSLWSYWAKILLRFCTDYLYGILIVFGCQVWSHANILNHRVAMSNTAVVQFKLFSQYVLTRFPDCIQIIKLNLEPEKHAQNLNWFFMHY